MIRALCLLLIAITTTHAEWKSIGNVTSTNKLPDGIELRTSTNAIVRVTAVGDLGFRVRASQSGSFGKDMSWALDPKFKPAAANVNAQESGGSISLKTAHGSAVIHRTPLTISFLDEQGKIVNEDLEPMQFDGAQFRIFKKMPEGELYYGLGDKTSLVLNDRAFTLWNTDAYGWQESTDPLYKTIPFFMAMNNGRGYGIFMDNTWRSSFDFGKEYPNTYTFGAAGGEINYYFYFGPDPKTVLTSYTAMTGHTPLPPLWTLGFQQSRYSYYPEQQVRDLVSTFRQHNIPLDAIYLDIDYQQENKPFTINRERFPKFESMISDLRKQGVSTIVINDLHVAKADYPPYNSGTKQDVFLHNHDGSQFVGVVWPGPAVFPDFTLTRARDWWGSQYDDFVKMGVRGIWNDMNEPSVFQVPSKTMPLDTVHRLDDGTTLPHLAAHNILGQQNSRATYEGLTKLESSQNERPFVLTRATYAGGQRFSATWTGDNSAQWNHMRMSLPTLLNLSISGMPMVGVDIGGFRGTGTPDLVTRWMWLGVFNPIYRNHSEKGSGNKEPWMFGADYERMMKAAIEERYRLLPYVYSTAEQSARTGMPIMRPMFLAFPEDTWLASNQEEFMFGDSMLIAPKVWEFNEPYQVALPGGPKGATTWFDYWTGKQYYSEVKKSGSFTAAPSSEGLHVEVKPALDQVPVFVKAGSIIAHQPVVQSTEFTPQGNLQLRVYPGPDCRATLYMDDGHSMNVGENFLRIPMTCSQDANSMTLALAPQQGHYKPWFQNVDVVFYGAPHASTTPGKYDEASHTVLVTVPFSPSGVEVKIAF